MKFLRFLKFFGVVFFTTFLWTTTSSTSLAQNDCPECNKVRQQFENMDSTIESNKINITNYKQQIQTALINMNLVSEEPLSSEAQKVLPGLIEETGCSTVNSFFDITTKIDGLKGTLFDINFHCPSAKEVESFLQSFLRGGLGEWGGTFLQPGEQEIWGQVGQMLETLEGWLDDFFDNLDVYYGLLEEWLNCVQTLSELQSGGQCTAIELDHNDVSVPADFDESVDCPDCEEILDNIDALEYEVGLVEDAMAEKNQELDDLLNQLGDLNEFQDDLQNAVDAAGCHTNTPFPEIDVGPGQAAGVMYGVTFHCTSEAKVEDLIKELENFWNSHERPADEDQLWDDIFNTLDDIDDLEDQYNDLIDEKIDLILDYLDCLDYLLTLQDMGYCVDEDAGGEGEEDTGGEGEDTGGEGEEEENDSGGSRDEGGEAEPCPDCDALWEEVMDLEDDIDAKEKEIEDKNKEIDDLFDELDENDKFTEDLQKAIENAGCDTEEEFENIELTGSGQAAGKMYGVTFWCKNEADVEKLIEELDKFWKDHDRPENEEDIWDDIDTALDELEDLEEELNELIEEKNEKLDDLFDCLWKILLRPDCPWPGDGTGPSGGDESSGTPDGGNTGTPGTSGGDKGNDDEGSDCPDCDELWEEIEAKLKEIENKETEIEDVQAALDGLFNQLDDLEDIEDAFHEDLEQAIENAGCDTTEAFANITVTSGQAAGVIHGHTFHCKNEGAVEDLIKELDKFWKDHDVPQGQGAVWDDIWDALDHLDELQDELDQLERELFDLYEDYLDCLWKLFQLNCPAPAAAGGGSEGESEDESGTGGFPDVLEHWAKSFVNTLKRLGIVSGDVAGYFHPDNFVTRAEVAKILAVLFGYDISGCDPNRFPDVGTEDWFCAYVTAVVAEDVFNGHPDGTFKPGNYITRAETVKVLVNAIQAAMENAPGKPFDDVPLGAWYIDFVHVAKKLGLIGGKTPTTFEPGSFITRGEFAKIAVNAASTKSLEYWSERQGEQGVYFFDELESFR